jgi:hypothetical protein
MFLNFEVSGVTHSPAELRAVGGSIEKLMRTLPMDANSRKCRDTVIAPMPSAQIFVAIRCLGARWLGLPVIA